MYDCIYMYQATEQTTSIVSMPSFTCTFLCLQEEFDSGISSSESDLHSFHNVLQGGNEFVVPFSEVEKRLQAEGQYLKGTQMLDYCELLTSRSAPCLPLLLRCVRVRVHYRQNCSTDEYSIVARTLTLDLCSKPEHWCYCTWCMCDLVAG